MSDQFLREYEQELAHLRRMGADFADRHPKIAGRLKLSVDAIEDPHVSRLIESVAFLNARIRRKLDDEFPELVDALLSVLYPHHLSPFPSAAIAQFECEGDLTAGFTIPAGTGVETPSPRGDVCRFRTTYSVTAWPIIVKEARLVSVPFVAPVTPRSAQAAAVISIALKTTNPNARIGEMQPGSLRFFVRGLAQHAYHLYEMVMNDVIEIAVTTSPRDKRPAILGRNAIKAVGFEENEGLLPYSGRSLVGNRLLTEYFAFPAKFLFFDLEGLPRSKVTEADTELVLYLYLGRTSDAMERAVTNDTFALSCSPIVNLFSKHAEPIRLTQEKSEYRIVPDARRAGSMEVFSVDTVSIVDATGRRKKALPFYGLEHGGVPNEDAAWWVTARRASDEEINKVEQGTETFLRLVDIAFDPSDATEDVADLELTCLNRDLPSTLPFGVDEPRLQFSDGGGPIKRIRCLTPPTKTQRAAQGKAAMWNLISQLSLNHLSLADGTGADALRELLSVHDRCGTKENKGIIQSILSVSSQVKAMRVVSNGQTGFCRGTEVTLHVDESRFTGNGVYLFGSVLERFLGSYCTLNSFVSLTLTSNARNHEVKKWQPRAGDRKLL